ncbi:hypothetical protein SAMN06265222_101748 [Neorhodopirellula lusitana]|uniref:Uncharacterized protein n=1 Tax=Neorhodopirellula lusitana TaxID=445327 RepID=A0ABY1PT29_9BACT|nr:hypothetical protein SAMN06265222_101748 [Neorhodopirellula lusitana]
MLNHPTSSVLCFAGVNACGVISMRDLASHDSLIPNVDTNTTTCTIQQISFALLTVAYFPHSAPPAIPPT